MTTELFIVTEGISGVWHYHISRPATPFNGLCSAKVMRSDIELSGWAAQFGEHFPKRPTWCDKCDALYKDLIRAPSQEELLALRELARLVRKRCKTAHPDWAPEIRAVIDKIPKTLEVATRFAVVQGSRELPVGSPGRNPGVISWEEHEEAWAQYARKHGTSQSAERINERGGFGYRELQNLLGRDPNTWTER